MRQRLQLRIKLLQRGMEGERRSGQLGGHWAQLELMCALGLDEVSEGVVLALTPESNAAGALHPHFDLSQNFRRQRLHLF